VNRDDIMYKRKSKRTIYPSLFPVQYNCKGEMFIYARCITLHITLQANKYGLHETISLSCCILCEAYILCSLTLVIQSIVCGLLLRESKGERQTCLLLFYLPLNIFIIFPQHSVRLYGARVPFFFFYCTHVHELSCIICIVKFAFTSCL